MKRFLSLALAIALASGFAGDSAVRAQGSPLNPATLRKVPGSISPRAVPAAYRWTDFGTEERLNVLRGSNPGFRSEAFVGLFTPGKPVNLAANVSATARVVGAPGTTGAAAQQIRRGAKIVVEVARLSNLRQMPQYGPGAPLVECIIAENDISRGSWGGQIQIYAGSDLVYDRKQADASKAGFPNFFAFPDQALSAKADRAVFTWTVGDAPKPAGKFARLGQCRLIWVTLQT